MEKMEIAEKSFNEIHIGLKKLLEQKSERDCASFTMYQLAKAINMPYSIISKLINPNPSKRVNNPRIDTLHRIVSFFQNDGFDVTIDDLLSGFKTNQYFVDPKSQDVDFFTTQKTLPVYPFKLDSSQKVGTVDIKLNTASKNTFALLTDEDIPPLFKRNSLFIVDPDIKPEHDMLVAVKIAGFRKILIRKLHVQGNEKKLLSYNRGELPIQLFPTMSYSIVGVVTQINAATS